KESGVPIESLGEFHELDTRTGRYVQRNPMSGTHISNDSIKRSLKRVQQHTPSRTYSRWAKRSLSQLDQMTRTNMKSVLTRKGSARFSLLRQSSKSGLARATRTTASQSLHRLTRAAGPIGAAVAMVMDSHEMYSHVAA